VADWSGYDASQQDQREFPDLSPIRPSHARPAGGQNQGDWPGQQPQPGPGGWQPGGGGYQNDGAGYPGGAQGYPPVGPGGSTGPSVIGQQWPQQDPSGPFGQQVQGQPGPLGQQAPGQPGSPRPPRAKQAEDDIPDWAEPDSDEAFSARWHRRGLDSRGDRRTDRRKRRRVLIAGGGVVAVVIAVAVYFLTGGSGSSSSLGFGSLVTTFLPGELQSVPDACDTVPNSMLSQYLPGTLKQSSPPLNTGANTQCSWTLDSPPTYRLLEVQLVAYSPSALYGNGSATVVAEENFASSQENFAKPGPKSGETPATVLLPGHAGVQPERHDHRRGRRPRPVPERRHHRGGGRHCPFQRDQEVRAGHDERPEHGGQDGRQGSGRQDRRLIRAAGHDGLR